MAITFEKDLTGAETLEIMLKYPQQVCFLDNWPDSITENDTYNEIMMKISDLEKEGHDWGKDPVRYVREYPEEQALRMVRENPRSFQWLKNPTESICEAAVEGDARNISLVPPELRSDKVMRASMIAAKM